MKKHLPRFGYGTGNSSFPILLFIPSDPSSSQAARKQLASMPSHWNNAVTKAKQLFDKQE
jgi:hypothetical protein